MDNNVSDRITSAQLSEFFASLKDIPNYDMKDFKMKLNMLDMMICIVPIIIIIFCMILFVIDPLFGSLVLVFVICCIIGWCCIGKLKIEAYCKKVHFFRLQKIKNRITNYNNTNLFTKQLKLGIDYQQKWYLLIFSPDSTNGQTFNITEENQVYQIGIPNFPLADLDPTQDSHIKNTYNTLPQPITLHSKPFEQSNQINTDMDHYPILPHLEPNQIPMSYTVNPEMVRKVNNPQTEAFLNENNVIFTTENECSESPRIIET